MKFGNTRIGKVLMIVFASAIFGCWISSNQHKRTEGVLSGGDVPGHRNNALAARLDDGNSKKGEFDDASRKNANRSSIDRGVEYCRNQIIKHGDYNAMANYLRNIPKDRTFGELVSIIGLSSPSGLEHDLINQLDLIGEVEDKKVPILKRSLYRRVAIEANWAEQSQLLNLIPKDDYPMVVEQTAVNFSPSFFALCENVLERTQNEEVLRSGVDVLLQRDAKRASMIIGSIGSDKVKDYAISRLVVWLHGNGSMEEAAQWANVISDTSLKTSIEELIHR